MSQENSASELRIVKLSTLDGFYKFFLCREDETDFDTLEGSWVTYEKQDFLDKYEEDYDNTDSRDDRSEPDEMELCTLLRSWSESGVTDYYDNVLVSEQTVEGKLFDDSSKTTFVKLIKTEAGAVARIRGW